MESNEKRLKLRDPSESPPSTPGHSQYESGFSEEEMDIPSILPDLIPIINSVDFDALILDPVTVCKDAEEDLNTPRPFEGKSDVFSQSFRNDLSSNLDSNFSSADYKRRFILERRDDIKSDGLKRKEKAPVQLAGPVRREEPVQVESDEDFEEESFDLTNFPLLVLALILVMIVWSLLYPSAGLPGLVVSGLLAAVGGYAWVSS